MEKDCKSCKHDGNQMFFRTACTGCSVDDILYQHWEEKTERNPNAESVSANPLLSDVLAEDLKCCGNCLYRQSIDMGNDFSEKCEFGNHMESSAYCGSWTWDNLLKGNRHD